MTKELSVMQNGGGRKIMKLDYQLFVAGHCTHLERITRKKGSYCSQKYPAICAFIRHPVQGNILFDTGYSDRFFKETNKWPFWIYGKVTPVALANDESVSAQLQKQGIKPEDISYIIISHFHADHIAGVQDFPNAQFITSKVSYDAVKDYNNLSALKNGYLAGLLPHDFEKRLSFIENQSTINLQNDLLPFQLGWDVFGDKSLLAIDLQGHAKGQFGILFSSAEDHDVFLVADACWSSKAFQQYDLPSMLTYLVHHNRTAYQETLKKLHQLYKRNKKIRIIPSHCQEIWREIVMQAKTRE